MRKWDDGDIALRAVLLWHLNVMKREHDSIVTNATNFTNPADGPKGKSGGKGAGTGESKGAGTGESKGKGSVTGTETA